MKLFLQEVLSATGGKLLQGARDACFEGVSTDSRTIREGELYIALKGAQFDGHHYSLEALAKKAGGVVVAINPQYKQRELEYQAADSGVEVLIDITRIPCLDEIRIPGLPSRLFLWQQGA